MKIKLDPSAIMPNRAHRTDAGLDLYAPEDVTIWPHYRKSIDTGVHVEIPEGYVGLLTSKSGLMAKHGILSSGTIDSGFTGSIKAVLFNLSDDALTVKKGQKITQLVLFPIITPDLEVVDELGDTERGEGGFGSTGDFATIEGELEQTCSGKNFCCQIDFDAIDRKLGEPKKIFLDDLIPPAGIPIKWMKSDESTIDIIKSRLNIHDPDATR